MGLMDCHCRQQRGQKDPERDTTINYLPGYVEINLCRHAVDMQIYPSACPIWGCVAWLVDGHVTCQQVSGRFVCHHASTLVHHARKSCDAMQGNCRGSLVQHVQDALRLTCKNK
jgi:hypothetical protein